LLVFMFRKVESVRLVAFSIFVGALYLGWME